MNEILDERLWKMGLRGADDISYKFKSIDPNGILKVEASFHLGDFERDENL